MEGSRPKESCLVTAGFAARSQSLRSGERQITAVHVPGDFVDLHSMMLKVMDHSVIALGPCKVAFIPHEKIREVTETEPSSWRACSGCRRPSTAPSSAPGSPAWDAARPNSTSPIWSASSMSGWRLPAWHRILTFEFPVTQMQLGDVLGLSVVHVNRKLQELRAAGLVEWRDGKVKIRDFERLAEMSEFDPTYLSLSRESR